MSLTIAGNVTLRFRGDGDRRWIDLKLFEFPPGAPDPDLLQWLVAHPYFRDGYMGGPPGNDAAAIHGPYDLNAVTPDRYERVNLDDARAGVEGFCSLHGLPMSTSLGSDIDAVVRRRLTGASSIYRLPPLAEDRHDAAWVLLEFRELVLISRHLSELALIVLGID
jgi:hypothetical protein